MTCRGKLISDVIQEHYVDTTFGFIYFSISLSLLKILPFLELCGVRRLSVFQIYGRCLEYVLQKQIY